MIQTQPPHSLTESRNTKKREDRQSPNCCVLSNTTFIIFHETIFVLEDVGLPQKRLDQLDVAPLFHSVLFAYQKALRGVLGEIPSSVITGQTVPIIEEIIGKASPELSEAKDTDAALTRFADLLMAAELASRAAVRKEDRRYILDIDGCVFAEHVHDMLNPKDVTCPWAITAMSIAQRTSKRKVKMSLSEFTRKGAKTPIEL